MDGNQIVARTGCAAYIDRLAATLATLDVPAMEKGVGLIEQAWR